MLILNLYSTSKRLYTQHQNAYTHTTSKIFTIKTKKEKAKKPSQVYMIPYSIINQKGTSKRIIPGLYDSLYYNKPGRNKQ